MAHINTMQAYPRSPVLQSTPGQAKPERNREEILSAAAELKLKRGRDASEAMKDHEAARLATLAKTARLRAERLARVATAIPAAKPAGRKSRSKILKGEA